MPIYEYVCLDCGERFEQIRPMKDCDEAITCRNCHSEHTSRQLSVFFAASGGKVIAGGNSGCSSCSGGSCASCHN